MNIKPNNLNHLLENNRENWIDATHENGLLYVYVDIRWCTMRLGINWRHVANSIENYIDVSNCDAAHFIRFLCDLLWICAQFVQTTFCKLSSWPTIFAPFISVSYFSIDNFIYWKFTSMSSSSRVLYLCTPDHAYCNGQQ